MQIVEFAVSMKESRFAQSSPLMFHMTHFPLWTESLANC